MTEYVKSTNFASKDALATGNPLKIVKGTEIDTEFNNIAVAVATKADVNSPTFIGTPAAPTASPGTNTTQLATTAFIAAAIAAAKEALYPVGSIYINAASSTNPATLLGFGTWVEFGAGRVMVGQNASDALFDTLEETGGSKDAVVVAHTHSFSGSGTTGAAGSHSHTYSVSNGSGSGSSSNATYNETASATTSTVADHTHTFSVSGTSGSTGSSGTNANLPPYIVVKMWKRTA